MSKEIYIICELFILLTSTLVTYFFVNRRKSFESYVATWKKLGTRLIWFLFLVLLAILYCYSLSSNVSKDTIIINIILLMFFIILFPILGVIIIGGLYEVFNKKKSKYKLKYPIKLFKEKIENMSIMKFDTLCKISYIFEIVFIFMLLFTVLSLILYFYSNIQIANNMITDDTVCKELLELINKIDVFYIFTIILAYFFWISDFMFTWFKLRNHINDSDENIDYKASEEKRKHENKLDRFDRNDIKI